jgi:hypothetical protein
MIRFRPMEYNMKKELQKQKNDYQLCSGPKERKRKHAVRITNKMLPCNRINYSKVY